MEVGRCSARAVCHMKYYAHTVEDGEARTLYTLKDGRQTAEKQSSSDLAEEQIGWQPLRTHLLNVAEMAHEFGRPIGCGDDAYCAGLFHDLGKYGRAFQRRLRGHGSGIKHWTAGAYEAYQAKAPSAAFAIDGHHKGIPKLTELQNLLKAYRQEGDWLQFGIDEPVATLIERARGDGVALPVGQTFEQLSKSFASALHTRFLFSCLVDADFLDTRSRLHTYRQC